MFPSNRPRCGASGEEASSRNNKGAGPLRRPVRAPGPASARHPPPRAAPRQAAAPAPDVRPTTAPSGRRGPLSPRVPSSPVGRLGVFLLVPARWGVPMFFKCHPLSVKRRTAGITCKRGRGEHPRGEGWARHCGPGLTGLTDRRESKSNKTLFSQLN